jgi:hypothetical protein
MSSNAYAILEMSVLAYATGFICSLLGHLACAKMTLALLLPMNFYQNSLAQGILLFSIIFHFSYKIFASQRLCF